MQLGQLQQHWNLKRSPPGSAGHFQIDVALPLGPQWQLHRKEQQPDTLIDVIQVNFIVNDCMICYTAGPCLVSCCKRESHVKSWCCCDMPACRESPVCVKQQSTLAQSRISLMSIFTCTLYAIDPWSVPEAETLARLISGALKSESES